VAFLASCTGLGGRGLGFIGVLQAAADVIAFAVDGRIDLVSDAAVAWVRGDILIVF
jgi:hypothetical protein